MGPGQLSQSFPEFPVHERDAVITVHGEKPWLHALENISALYGSEVIVYLSASAAYDSRYIEKLVEVLQHSQADIVVSADYAAGGLLPHFSQDTGQNPKIAEQGVNLDFSSIKVYFSINGY
ncbi:hypothetical protein R50912_28735 [Paenibacillus sp. FSL R5-0912]|nr:hypothetical protein R50912_28735 [Paenibacillus sp. FSL R5-0912]